MAVDVDAYAVANVLRLFAEDEGAGADEGGHGSADGETESSQSGPERRSIGAEIVEEEGS